MSAIAEQWLGVYRAALGEARKAHPSMGRSTLVGMAKLKANAAVPEGQECIAEFAMATMGGGKAETDAYSVALGRAIVVGIKRTNREVLGGDLSGPEEAAMLEGTRADLATLGVTPTQAIRRPSMKERAELVQKYTEWADAHSTLPSDTTLAHFTAWGRQTWAKVRDAAETRGYKFEVTGGHGSSVKVLARPSAGKAGPEWKQTSFDERLARIEAAIAALAKGNGR